jgi:Tfp pilus assembly protein PilE
MYRQAGHKQSGMTFIGLVLIIAMVVFIATIGIKLYPPYVEFLTIKKAITKIANDPSFAEMTPAQIKDNFDKSASIDSIRVITSNDLTIEKSTSGKPVAVAEYQVVVPIAGNISALLDFNASTDPNATITSAPAAEEPAPQ